MKNKKSVCIALWVTLFMKYHWCYKLYSLNDIWVVLMLQSDKTIDYISSFIVILNEY